MKSFHVVKGTQYDFSEMIFNKIQELLKQTDLDLTLLPKIEEKCQIIFKENTFGLIHGDLHFDNILYDGNELNIIDFERWEYAPIDYDLKIFASYEHHPYLWASVETDLLTIESDYQNFIEMILNNYTELKNMPYIHERLAVYFMINCLDNYKNTRDEDMKKLINETIKKLLLKN